ncbi:MAG: hypothetical protein K1060chlam4_00992 [Candidatus Anoxychlamydiales bacterium]|nr:hypothetical protein [Candidatus Anoxychlamydiales bacterium]
MFSGLSHFTLMGIGRLLTGKNESNLGEGEMHSELLI